MTVTWSCAAAVFFFELSRAVWEVDIAGDFALLTAVAAGTGSLLGLLFCATSFFRSLSAACWAPLEAWLLFFDVLWKLLFEALALRAADP